MPYYSELNPIMNALVSEKLLRSQNICKLLSYYPDTNLDNHVAIDFDPLSQPDVVSPNSLYMKYLFPLPKIPDAQTEKVCFLACYLGGAENPLVFNYKNIYLYIDIICHVDAWIIRDGNMTAFRPYSLMYEIDKLLNNQQIGLSDGNVAISKCITDGFQPRNYTYQFYGEQLRYRITLNSNIQC